MPLTPEQRAMATTELEQLQSVIARHEGHTFKIRGWPFAVVSALTAR
jgi:hypothetical protein